MGDGSRIVDTNSSFVAMAPYASISPYEILLLPRESHPFFEDVDDASLVHFGTLLHRVLRRLCAVLPEFSYNMILRSAPVWSRQAHDYSLFYSWHCSIYPRLGAGAMAGFEIGS